ncbi:hypothetical protein N0V95_003554 [Ascochyta clinopodiicola]|nr:hypothetical protein N0V95_003554 [Ascochyta clinopodiicola]
MKKDLRNNPDDLWQKTLEEYRKIKESLDAPTTMVDLKQIDKENIINNSIASVGQFLEHATAAIPVVGQAKEVFAALRYLTETVQCYKENYTAEMVLQRLKENSGTFERLASYMGARQEFTATEDPLLRLITQTMTMYLQLCAHHAKVKADSQTISGQWKNWMKATIRWDGGIGDCIKQIDKLSRQEVSMNVAALRVSDIKATEQRLKADDTEKLRLLLKVRENEEHWVDMQNELERSNVPQIGDWLFDEPSEFKAWADMYKRPEHAVLWLTGKSGYGKTHLCSRVIQHLKESIKLEERPHNYQISVAWFYLRNRGPIRSSKGKEKEPDASKKMKKDKDNKHDRKEDMTFRDIMQALVWQLAQSDRIFQRFVVEQFRKYPRGSWKSSEIWEDLIKAFCHEQQPGDLRRFFFLIIDGDDTFTNDKTKEAFRKMQTDSQSLCADEKYHCQVRILIARTEAPSSIVANINLPEAGRDLDVKVFIEYHLKNLFATWPKATDGYRTMHSLEKRLIVMFSAGSIDYPGLVNILDVINRIGTSHQSLLGLRKLRKALAEDNTINVYDFILPSQLAKLNQELEDGDKEVFNDLMSFLVCLNDWPSIDQLDALLSLKSRKHFEKRLETEIQEKYSNILTVSPEKIVVSNNLLEFFRRQYENKNTSWMVQMDEDRATSFDRTHELELTKLLTPTSTAEDWTTIVSNITKLHRATRPRLRFDHHASHIMTIKLLLKSICSEDHVERVTLREVQSYTGMRLPWHLWCAKILPIQIGNDSKRSIGENLYKFFWNERSVKTWLSQSDPQDLREHYWCEYLEDVQYWLKDEEVLSGFKGARHDRRLDPVENRDGISEVLFDFELRDLYENNTAIDKSTNEKEVPTALYLPSKLSEAPGARDQLLLHLVIKISASQWLEEFNWNASQALQWLITVAHKAIETKELYTPELNLATHRNFIIQAYKAIEKNELSKDDILEAEKWAANLLKIWDTHSSLHFIKDVRVAQTLVEMEIQPHHELAEERCELAQDHESSYLEASLLLSRISEMNGNNDRALQELLKVRTYIQSSLFKQKFPDRWRDELERFWHLCHDTMSVKEALTACKDLSDQSAVVSAGCIERALEWMLKTKDLSEAFGVMSAARETDGRSLLTAVLFSTAASNAKFHQHLHLAFKKDPNQLWKGYTDAILGPTDAEITPRLRYWYGVSLFYHDRSRDAIQEWEDLCLELQGQTEPTKASALLFTQTAERLASVYIGSEQGRETRKETLAKRIKDLHQWKHWIDHHLKYTINYLALLLGRLYQVTGKFREARHMVRDHLVTAFKLLEDDRIGNDRKAYFRIAEALFCLDDERNALAAWSLVACAPAYEDELALDDINELAISCAGDCDWSWDGRKDLDRDLYLCRDCAHVRFEESCYKKLCSGLLEQTACWKKHKLTKVPKTMLRDRDKIITGHVIVGGKVEKVDTWIAAARRQYDIPEAVQPWTDWPTEFPQIAIWKVKRHFGDNFRRKKTPSTG